MKLSASTRACRIALAATLLAASAIAALPAQAQATAPANKRGIMVGTSSN